jgi:hypothetical protein
VAAAPPTERQDTRIRGFVAALDAIAGALTRTDGARGSGQLRVNTSEPKGCSPDSPA